MEFYEELFITAAISVVLFFIIGKLAAFAPASGAPRRAASGDEVSLSAGDSADVADPRLLEENPCEAEEPEPPSGVDDVWRAGSRSPDEEQEGVAEVKGEEEIQAEVEHEGRRDVERKAAAAAAVVDEEVVAEEEWEGIERSELEKLFCSATAFVRSEVGELALSELGNDVQMQLYGLQKIATEGPCYESQPMALKVTARAKWNSWQRLGTMNPEDAMEEYISILSGNLPGWSGEKSSDQGTKPPLAAGTKTPYLKELMPGEADPKTGRKSEDPSCIEGESSATGTRHVAHEVLTQSFHVNLLSPIVLPILCLLL